LTRLPVKYGPDSGTCKYLVTGKASYVDEFRYCGGCRG
jgi:hypothetical protein